MEILKANKITKIYNERTDLACVALKDVTISINEGDFIAIMGPSGAGKTTLVHNLSSIDKPTKGVVKLFDQNITLLDEYDIAKYRNEFFGFIFQELNLIKSLTIYENVALPILINKKEKGNVEEKVTKILEELKISDCRDKYPDQCSGGQQQRAAIARALIKNPKLLVADEPTGNLDSKNSKELLEILAEMNKTMNVSILVVTHDPSIASYSKRFLYIKDGRIDAELDRGDMDQAEFFKRIVEINTNETIG